MNGQSIWNVLFAAALALAACSGGSSGDDDTGTDADTDTDTVADTRPLDRRSAARRRDATSVCPFDPNAIDSAVATAR
ncbi:MAG TPA: hypothetical protein VM285_09945 [Polyangia bacterium]|nr:hypothetical protein [Polyangia bacterium]